MIMSASISAAFFSAFKALALGIMISTPAIFGRDFGEDNEGIDIDIGRFMERALVNMPLLKGIEELMKNSKDYYRKMAVAIDDRWILVIFRSDVLHIIDLGGMNLDQFQQWKRWADDAAEALDMVEGGQGLGGKGAMVNIPTQKATIESVGTDGRLTAMGFNSKAVGIKRFMPVYMKDEDGNEIKDVETQTPTDNLIRFLEEMEIERLWGDWNEDDYNEFIDTLERRQTYTIVSLYGLENDLPAKSREKKDFVRRLCKSLVNGPQIQQTLEDSRAILVDLDNRASLLKPEYPEAIDEIADVEEFFGPEIVKDPQTGLEISLEGGIVMCSSKQDMKNSPRFKSLNGFRVRDRKNIVWTIDSSEIDSDPSVSRHLFGTIGFDEDLGSFADINRANAPDKPVPRAITQLVKDKTQEFRARIKAANTATTNPRNFKPLDKHLDDAQNALHETIDLDLESGDDGKKRGTRERQRLETTTITDLYYFGEGQAISESLVLIKGVGFEVTPVIRGRVNGQRAVIVDDDAKLVNARDYVYLESSDSGIVEVDGFELLGMTEGEAFVTMKVRDMLAPSHPEAVSKTWRVVVDTLTTAPDVRFAIEPEIMNIHSDIEIDGNSTSPLYSSTGVQINSTHINTGYKITIEGDMSLVKRFPPVVRTNVVPDGVAEGKVTVRWGFLPHQIIEMPFETSEEIHVPQKKKDGGNGWPKLVRCGVYIDGDTVNGGIEMETIIRDPTWDAKGIRWLNPHSRKARQATISPKTGKPFDASTQAWKRWANERVAEMAHDILSEKRSTQYHNPTIDDWIDIRNHVELNAMAPFYDRLALDSTGVQYSSKESLVALPTAQRNTNLTDFIEEEE